MAAFEDLGLLVEDTEDRGRVVSPVGLCPTRGLYFAFDRGAELGPMPDDAVYPAILENTQNFLDSIPATRCRAFLDLGAGTGVAALLAAKGYAEHAWACDITARSVHFSEFNRRLNAIGNVTVAQGDLYEAVGDRQFDRIVTHPPYVPVSKPTQIFRDGGDDGELIIRRAIEGLPRNLAPGGRFYAMTLVSERENETAEARVRAWLGATGDEFDVALVAETTREPFDFLGRAMQKGTHRPEELLYWASMYRSLKVKYLVYGAIVVQRHAEARAPFTLRLQQGPRSGPAETEWALRWNTEAGLPGAAERLLAAPLALSPELNLAVLHRMREGALVAEEFLVRVKHPFDVECKCPAWTAALFRECDGRRTGAELLDRMRASGAVDRETSLGDFADVLSVLVGSGFIETAAFAIPRRASTQSAGNCA
jgi:SAM-dependent methyltransferase